ncbi:hypothetical protein TNIN_310991 [Trichonephila inaurata madagascariensis]|uniref:Uncharacterized protein n=1 Tax=Trichonephila inaurata madagascariensis TaxID=2747483 RepID=A0A8X6MDY8_9ARAC|nr:hypothetical protein TNIN_310991 [Trichonephila inaurata madagascariensis]
MEITTSNHSSSEKALIPPRKLPSGWRRVILESNRCLVAVHHRGCRERQYRVCRVDRKSPRKDLPTSVIALLPCDKIDRKMGAKKCATGLLRASVAFQSCIDQHFKIDVTDK